MHRWGDVEVSIDRETRVLGVDVGDSGGRVVIEGGRLEGWTVIFDGPLEMDFVSPVEERHDGRGVSGCLTIREVELVDARFEIRGSACEDGLHLLRSKGSIASVSVVGALSDAVDMDFSTIRMESIVATDAGNDCLDLSMGRYEIGRIQVERCGDKGLSAGEAAVVEIDDMSAVVVSVGIAVKDSARVDVGSALIGEGICAMTYRKKREFSGGELRIGRLDCDSGDVRQQEGSLLAVGP